jgi:hypothetical protein
MKRHSSNQTNISQQDALAAYPHRDDDHKQPIVSKLFNRRQFIGASVATGAVIGSMSLNGCVSSPTAQEKVNIVKALTPAVNPVYINLGDFDYAA